LAEDGIFGNNTQTRVKEFQTRNQLVPDGIVGPLTLSLIQLALNLLKQLPTPPVAAGPYNRSLALDYAKTFFNRICSDGKHAMKTGYPAKINGVRLKPGMPHADIGPLVGEEDCTHFMSCCIGRPPVISIDGTPMKGGQLPLTVATHMKKAGAYGQDFVENLVTQLKLRKFATVVLPEFMPITFSLTRKAIVENLKPGDLIAYAGKEKTSSYGHLAMMVSSTGIACHSSSRNDKDFTEPPFPLVTLLKFPP
jgi:Putative peptidoglycan binding domain